ncbi:putative lipid II flippase FtsW [Patescibacteria group bacterium]|nr:putative lipid II flippase FtsW [Patescibacteria group bacterium]
MLQRRKKYDHVLLLAVLAIVIVGVVMITSIGVPKSIRISAPDLAYPDCADDAVDCYLVLKNHVVRVLFGLVAMLVAWKINYRFWKKISFLFFLGAVGLLIFVLFAGDQNNTFATSWINVGAIPFIDSIQPSEIAKFGLVLYLSYFFTEKISKEKMQHWNEGFLKFAIISGVVILPIMLQPDLGSTLVMAVTAVAIYWLAGANWKHLAVGALMAGMVAFVVVANVDYIKNRFSAFIFPDSECVEEYCWQSRQANIAIGSGGLWGKGLTQGIQKSYWLPQASDDFIFAASAEELGFLRTALVVLLYALIAYRGLQIANHAPNKFAMLTAAGLTTWISSQAFINIMVNTSLFPITGITLPFMSYGGSSMVTTLLAVGVLLNISKYTTQNAYSNDRRGYRGARRSQSGYSGRYQRSY